MIEIDNTNLKTNYDLKTRNYIGNFYVDYKIEKLSFLQTKIIPFFKFSHQMTDRLKDRSGVFSKFNSKLKTEFFITQYVKYYYDSEPFMPYGVFVWFDKNIGNEYNIEPVIDYSKNHLRYYYDEPEKDTEVCLIGFNIYFSTLVDQMKYKLISS